MMERISIEYDAKAGVWVASSSVGVGIALEATTEEELRAKVEIALKDLEETRGV